MKRILAFTLATLSNVAIADDVVINATKLDKSLTNLTQSVTVITEEDIKEKSYSDLTEVLRHSAGIEFKQAGGPGQFNYPMLRGFNSSSNLLIVIDGVKINKASSGNVGHLVGQIDPSNVEKIEILRGPQAALYGANSTAGVISITTKSGEVTEAYVGIEAGSLGWRKTYGSFRDSKKIDSGLLLLSLNHSNIDSDNVHPEEYYENTSRQIKLEYKSDLIQAGISYWETDNEFGYAELDEAYCCQTSATHWAFQTPDPHQFSATEDEVLSIYVKHTITKSLSQKIQLGSNHNAYTSQDLDDGLLGYQIAPYDNFQYGYDVNWDPIFYSQGAAVPITDSGSDEALKYRDKTIQVDYNLIYKTDTLAGLLGIESYKADAKQYGRYGELEGDADHDSIYLNGEYASIDTGFVIAVGLRHDNYEDWDQKTTGNIGLSYRFVSTTIFTNYGTSYKTPTLSNLLNPGYGDPDLGAEEGKTGELGLRQELFRGRLNWDATLWYTELEDVIFYDQGLLRLDGSGESGRYNNGDEQQTHGIELNASYDISTDLTLSGNYTYTDSHIKKVNADWERTPQIPNNKANLDLTYRVENIVTSAHAYYTGSRYRWAGDVEMKEYVRFDVSARIHLTDGLTVYTRIENLFDEEITEGLGYKQPGTYAIAGFDYNFQ